MNEWRGIKSRAIDTCDSEAYLKQFLPFENNSTISKRKGENKLDDGLVMISWKEAKIFDSKNNRLFPPLHLKERNYNYSKCRTLPLEDAVFLPPPFFPSTNPNGGKPLCSYPSPLFPPRQPGERQRVPNSHRANHRRQRSRRWWCVWPSSRIIWLSFQKWDRWGRREFDGGFRPFPLWKGMEIEIGIRILFRWIKIISRIQLWKRQLSP